MKVGYNKSKAADFNVLSAKQSGIKYHFLSLWYDSSRDWIPVSRTISEHYSLGSNTMSIFKQNHPGLNSEFSFTYTGGLTNGK